VLRALRSPALPTATEAPATGPWHTLRTGAVACSRALRTGAVASARPLLAGAVACALALGVGAAPARAQPGPAGRLGAGAQTASPAAPDARFTFQFRETELTEIVRALSQRTGRAFLFDDRLRGRATLLVPRPVGGDEAEALVVSALRLAGFAALETPGGPIRILPLADAGGQAPVSDGMPRAYVDDPVTTLVPLRAAAAEALLPIVGPMVGANGVAQAFTPTNALILSGTEGQLHRALTVIRALDRAEESSLLILRPRFRNAEDMLELVVETFPESQQASQSLRVVADARSNALVVEGPPDLVAEVRSFVDRLDLPQVGRGRLQVVRLRHADAEELGAVLQDAAAADPAGGGAAQIDPEFGDLLAGREFALSVDSGTNSLVIRSSPETFQVLASVIKALDIQRPAVMVRLAILEVRSSDDLEVAIDTLVPLMRPGTPAEGNGFLRTLNSGDPSVFGPTPAEREGLVFRFLDDPVQIVRTNADGEEVVETLSGLGVDVRAVETVTDVRILSEPQLLATSGEEQELFVGNNIPIISAQTQSADAAVDPLLISQNIERQDVGLELRVTPTVSPQGPVRLDLFLETTALGPPVAGDPDRVGPSLLNRVLEATIYLDDGTGAAVGGRLDSTQDSVVTGSPWLMDIPFLGAFFRGESVREVHEDLVITVQVQVLRSPEELELESIRRRIALERAFTGYRGLRLAAHEAPFGLRIATTKDRISAESIGAGVDPGPRARVEIARWGDPERYDVLVVGFPDYAAAVGRSLDLRAEGYDPELLPLPERI